MKDEKMDRGREEGLRKYALIAPLLEEGVPAFEMARRRSLLREQQGISERTLRERRATTYRHLYFDDDAPIALCFPSDLHLGAPGTDHRRM